MTMVRWAVDNWFQILVVLFLFQQMRALHALGRVQVSRQTVEDYWRKLEILLVSISQARQSAPERGEPQALLDLNHGR